MKKLTLKQQLEVSQVGWGHLAQFIFELMQCSIGDSMLHFVFDKKDFKYDEKNIEELFQYLERDMTSYKEQIEYCSRRAFPKEEYASEMSKIFWEDGAQRYVKLMKASLLKQAKKEEAKKAAKKGKKNETRIRPRTKR
jgi:hypothetical protein